jgi:phage replication-related protein YjqB (UPF0714/DUF867 family)
VSSILRRNEIETAYAAKFTPNKDKFSKPHSREHCSLNANQIQMMEINTGQQVRIERPTENGITLALYTIESAHDEEPNYVFLDYIDPDDVEKRFRVPTVEPFQCNINSQVASVGLDDDHAKAYSEFVEHLADDDYNSELVVIAPHGGDIEEHTDEQAKYVAQQLPSNCVSAWMCKGFKKGGGAFARWHITSTDISEESFPKLKTIYGRPFKFAIAFHGWGGDSICIGGTDPDQSDCPKEEISLKEEIKCAIEKAVSGSESDPDGLKIEVVLGDDGDSDKRCPQNFNGNNPKNIVNRLGTTAVQIEQCEKARNDKYRLKIAGAVVKAIRSKLAV